VRAKTVHALDREATVTDLPYFNISKNNMADARIYEMRGIQATLSSKILNDIYR
jgi:hypothetical protein